MKKLYFLFFLCPPIPKNSLSLQHLLHPRFSPRRSLDRRDDKKEYSSSLGSFPCLSSFPKKKPEKVFSGCHSLHDFPSFRLSHTFSLHFSSSWPVPVMRIIIFLTISFSLLFFDIVASFCCFYRYLLLSPSLPSFHFRDRACHIRLRDFGILPQYVIPTGAGIHPIPFCKRASHVRLGLSGPFQLPLAA